MSVTIAFSIFLLSLFAVWLTDLPAAERASSDAVPPNGKLSYAVHENVVLSKIWAWTGTSIHVPRGALAAILATGEIRHVGQRQQVSFQPFQLLWFRVGLASPSTVSTPSSGSHSSLWGDWR